MRKIIKKIMAIGAISLLGATMAGAAVVQDLANYPDMFIENGKFNAAIVVGKNAAAEDVVGAIDIGTGLQYNYAGKDGEVINTFVGDIWPVSTPSNKLEMTEKIKDVKSYVGKDELIGLSDGIFKSSKGNYEYEQELVFSDKMELKFDKNDDDKIDDFIVLDDDKNIANYTLNFKVSAESDIDGTDLDDFKNKEITIMGKQYTITEAYYNAGHIKLTLMAGAIEDILSQSETRSYKVDGVDYKVKVLWIGESSSTSKVKFEVNDEITDSLAEGETFTLKDGNQIGVREILEEEAGEVVDDQVEFYLGVQKVVLEDTNIQDAVSDKYISIGSDNIDNTKVIIQGTVNGNELSMTSISLDFFSDEDVFIGANQRLSDKLNEPEGLLSWDIRYEGLTAVDTEDIIVDGNDDELQLKVKLEEGVATIPLAYSADSTKVRLGDQDDKLVINRSNVIKDQYMILTDKLSHGGKTYILQYKGSDVPVSGNPVVKLKDIATGEILERSLVNGQGTLSLGGSEYTITNTTVLVDDFNIKVAGGSSEIITDNEAKITLIDANEGSEVNDINVTITYVDNDIVDDKAITPIEFTIKAGNDIEITKPEVLSNGFKDEDITSYTNELGAEITYEEMDGPDELKIKWPSAQRYGQAFITIGAAKVDISESVKTDKIEIPPAKLDSEIIDYKAENLIVVGGPCANSVASSLLGIPQDDNCYKDFKEGEGIIKLVQNGDKIAIVAAGFSALDTRKTAKVLRDFKQYDLTGDEIQVIGTSMTDITVKTMNGE